MAAVTDNQARKQTKTLRRIKVPLAASFNAYEDTFIMTDGSGYGASTPASGSTFLGLVAVQADNSSGSNGDLYADVKADVECLVDFPAADLAQTDVGALVYCSNNNDMTKTSGGNAPRAGRITQFVTASSAWVQLAFGDVD